ncbi:MAG: amidohydrolase [Schwartzia sp.]|nr:amidohydrolase [Schwartzia sp. (in: firmicutes)]
MERREFLKLGFMGALSAWLGHFPARAEAAGAGLFPSGRRIDFHAHAILPSYAEGLRRLGIDALAEEGFPLPKWSVEAHLQFMADAGIDYSVLSMPTPHTYNCDAALARAVTRQVNEKYAALCRAYPDKFGFVAALPLPDVEGAIAEIAYAMDNLGALGVKVASNSDGVYLGDDRFDPVFAEMDRRGALVILHPSPARQLPREGVVTGGVMALYEYPADTTRAVLNLLANGTLEKFPRIRLVVPHCGSFLPYMKSRSSGMFKLLASMGRMQPVDLAAGLKNLWFDLAGDPAPDQMEMLLRITDAGHIVYGSDYPYVLAPILLKRKEALDIDLARRGWTSQVYAENAKKLLGLTKSD